MRCPRCQHENRQGARFCEQCGAKLQLICPNCGSEIANPQARFCDECGTRLAESAPTPTEAAVPKLEDMQKLLQDRIPQSLADKLFAGAKQMQGEYRLVTAIFADVSGSSVMAREMPLEQYVETMNNCFKMMVDTISIKYEGSINRFIGDCVLAFFGAPIIHENDAERAILAALDIRDGVKELSLDVSIGINTGMTYVGEMGSDLIYSERSAWGPDVDFARRLQEAAKPGDIYVGASTYRLISRAFEFDKPVEIEIKHMERNQAAYPVIRIKEHPEKLRGIEGMRARMIGREHEFAALTEAADEWLDGQGQIVSVIGEAGIGKSRLVRELKEYLASRIQNPASSILEGRCVSIGQPISYWPFLDILRSWFGFTDEDTEAERAGKVRGKLEALLPEQSDDMLPFLGYLMNLKFGGELDTRLTGYSAEHIQQRTVICLRNILVSLSHHRGLLLVLEDLHWADDLSLNLISVLMDELMDHRLMLVCVYRAEQKHRVWQLGKVAQRKCLERYREIRLQQLRESESRRLVHELLAIDDLPDSVRDMILEKSEGNPFFIEEVIRSLIERDLVYQENGRWKAKHDIAELEVPDTIQSVILARVDRLQAETRYVLQCASVIGRLFKHRLLGYLTQKQQELDSHLDELEDRQLVHQERVIPEIEYAFEHALTQEATYRGILEQRRRAFHREVAQWIERIYQERIQDFYEELAHHWERSGDREKTLEYLIKAGEKAARNYLNDVAIGYYTRALQLAEELGISGDSLADIYEGRGAVYQSISFLEECVSDTSEAARLYTKRIKRASMYARISVLYYGAIHQGQASDEGILYARKAIEEIDPADKSREAIETYIAAGWALDLEDGKRILEKAISTSEEEGYRDLLARLYTVLCYLYPSGLQEQVQLAREKALSYLPYLRHNLRGYAPICNVLAFSGSESEKVSLAREALEAAVKSGQSWSVVTSAVQLGPYYLRQGETERAIEIFEQGWQAGVRVRQIHWTMNAVTRNLMHLYVSTRQMAKLHEMMLQMVDSTFVMHGKPIVYPIMRQRWNKVVEETCEFLRIIAPEVYHELEHSLESRLREADADSVRFFYLGQLTLLALLDNRQEDAESLARELLELRPRAGNFAKRVSQRVEYAAKLLNSQKGQRPSIARKLLDSFDSFENFQEAVNALAWVLPKDMIAQSVDWDRARHITLDYVQGHVTNMLDSFSPVWIQVGRLYGSYGHEDDLRWLLDQMQQSESDAMRKYDLTQLLLEQVELPEPGSSELLERFAQDPVSAGWEWVNPAGTCSYMVQEGGDLQVTVLPDHDLWIRNKDAPRMLRHISGDFIAETKISDGDDGKKSGGLLVWKDEANYIRLEVPSSSVWEDVVYYGANVAGRFMHPGIHPFEAPEAWLRLERKGDGFMGYVSSDGKNWYSCGWADIPMEDPIQVGIHALCPQSPATSTRFECFRIYRAV